MDLAYVGLGSNLGAREATIEAAIASLASEPTIDVRRRSTLRETVPWGREDQPAFLNGVVELEVTCEPRELLETLLGVERALGRVRDGERWGPRVIDLDLLLFGARVLDEPGLTIPHPHLAERRFVLEPLAELAPELDVPGLGRVAALLEQLPPE